MTIRRRRARGLIAAVVLLLGVAPSCSVEDTLPPPDCEEGGSSLIVAQSVPTATQIPCFLDLPTGWSFASVLVDEARTVVTLDSDRVGEGAAVLRLEETCDVSDAVAAPSDQPAAERYDQIERLRPGLRAERFYEFPGGCVWWRFDFDSGTSATEAVAIGEALVLVSRADLNESLRETFIDEEI